MHYRNWITSGITSPYIQFTDEICEIQILTFFNGLITVTGGNKLETSVFRKATNTICISAGWNKGTLRNLIQRLILICSNQKLLKDKLDYPRDVFIETNVYPPYLANSIINLSYREATMIRNKLLPIVKIQKHNFQ